MELLNYKVIAPHRPLHYQNILSVLVNIVVALCFRYSHMQSHTPCVELHLL
ncbi:hypothetical protein BDB01DRAFT_857463 [Pilobolus umbonatus]|nr:hypothetical protein BDB01DRAFT_857463 [Pilobolus umbonatus]